MRYPRRVRWLTILALVTLPTIAVAKPKPKIAVAPLDDDSGDKVGAVVVEVASAHARVTGLEKTKRAIDDLGVSLDRKGLQKLRVKLEVEIVIHGSVNKENGKREVELELSGHGKAKAKLVVSARSPKALRAELTKSLAKKIAEVEEMPAPSTGDDDDDDTTAKPVAIEDKPRKLNDDDTPKQTEDKPRHDKPSQDEDRPRKHVAVTGDDDTDNTSVHAGSGGHKHHHHHEGVEEPRDVETQGWLLLDAGLEVGRRTLRFASSGTEGEPPWVGTAGAAGVIGGELYPLAQDSPSGIGGLGIYGDYAKTLGVSISVPNSMGLKSSIDTGHYEVGLRYRLAFGTTSSLAFGAGYWSRYYNADRSALATMPGLVLDMPDVDYKALAPNVIYRFASGSSFAGYAQAEVPLILASGGIGAGTATAAGPRSRSTSRPGSSTSLPTTTRSMSPPTTTRSASRSRRHPTRRPRIVASRRRRTRCTA